MSNENFLRCLTSMFLLAFLICLIGCNTKDENQNHPPSMPSNPNPTIGSQFIPLDQIITWQCSDPENDQLTFNIFFGTASPPPIVVSNTNEFSYKTYSLERETKYYWKVDASDGHSTTTGTIWDFTTTNADSGTYIDPRDGQLYHTVDIGDQTWMVENLNYETGNSLCYDNNPANCVIYGRLYNWATIMNGEASSNNIPSGVQGICPPGWHVPSDAEWSKLCGQLGGYLIAGGKMKETGFVHWTPPNAGATNESGFTALPGGRRKTDGTFIQLGEVAVWWSSTEISGGSTASVQNVYYDIDDMLQFYISKANYFSLRCIKD
jgi:uncharacterized protein (TIGR02145 family)